jgi:integrase
LLHKASGQGVVRLSGKDFYVGPFGTPLAKAEYDQRVAEWLAAGRQLPIEKGAAITVAELIAGFWTYANDYFRYPDGTTTTEISCYREALGPLRRLYGHTPAASFGPLALKAVRQAMIDADLCRKNINRRIGRVKRVFKWGVENELVPPNVIHGLQAVAGLKAGRSAARESKPVKPVPDKIVNATRPFVSRQVAAMIQLMSITGMRPGEAVIMRGMDLDRTGRQWEYRPSEHKTQYLGHERIVFLGSQAQKILKPFLRKNDSEYLFSPSEAEAARRTKMQRLRKTPPSCGNVPGSNVKKSPLKKPGERYSVGSLLGAIDYACRRAFPLPDHLLPRIGENGKRESRKDWEARLTTAEKTEIEAWHRDHKWHTNQLRHSAGTKLRKKFGIEKTGACLGQRTVAVTELYAEQNMEAAKQIMAEVG